MDFIIITDTLTGKEITITQQAPDLLYVVARTGEETEEVRKRSIGKVMRTWMQLRMKDIG